MKTYVLGSCNTYHTYIAKLILSNVCVYTHTRAQKCSTPDIRLSQLKVLADHNKHGKTTRPDGNESHVTLTDNSCLRTGNHCMFPEVIPIQATPGSQ